MAAQRAKQPRQGRPGVGVDIAGWPVRDPTENVIANLADAVKRLDDLRAAEQQLTAARLSNIEQVGALRALHANEMRVAEAARLDAIRAVDVAAVKSAAEVSATQALALAAQVATSAEAMRNQVAAAANTTAQALGAALEPIQKDVADLRRVQYEQQGQRTATVETKVDQRTGTATLLTVVGIAVVGLLSLLSLGATVAIAFLK